MKILANDGISKSGIDQLENAGFNVETKHINQSDLVNYINENKIEMGMVEKVMEKYSLDPEKPSPINV